MLQMGVQVRGLVRQAPAPDAIADRLHVHVGAPGLRGGCLILERQVDGLDGFPNLQLLPVGKEVTEIAGDLRAAHEIRTPDALHLATAIHAGA